MQSSRGPPPHGTTPSPPTDRPHSNTHSAIPGSFHTPESVPPPSSPPFFTMNPLTDHRLTGSMMPYHPVDHQHALPSTSAYQDTISWQYAAWDAPVLDPATSSEHPSSTSLHTLGGMVSPSHEGTFAPPLPPPRAAVLPRNPFLGIAHPSPSRRFPAPPPANSTGDARETLPYGSVDVSASSTPATSPPHLSQGVANPSTMQPFAPSPDIWQPSRNTGVNVCPSPVATTAALGSLVTSSLGENLKGKVIQRRSPTESTRGSARYDPLGKQARATSRPTAVTSATAAATTSGATGSEQLTDEGEERDSDGSVRDVRDKKRRYAKTFRDIEKLLFEKLRHRLFPQDPHAKRSECLERAIESVDELLHLRESEARHHKEIEDLRQQLADAERRIERLYRELNGRSLTMGSRAD
ncbi:hypothetical protein BJV77DRAFT_1070686 [Russula vinacea]|nr:hypothetical protein BJV77DRAFT_1070686 [Russula vinacea]